MNIDTLLFSYPESLLLPQLDAPLQSHLEPRLVVEAGGVDADALLRRGVGRDLGADVQHVDAGDERPARHPAWNAASSYGQL